ncbi:helix-turn-helix domain-containing protein [Amycolatopsis sp. FBCC-B4732]|uniref:helix-turn-helix domain-containing protein n=1 Tax=Amycolatopsis sp. FBCC-B4732 TaxID=3079339 RepID=UPI001FF2385F|nr:helix-turn-helix domain-containing protein [Amycolatopsis sp. FBCC-B4732]UOX85307.1 helix-turn-helix domain-containing protein [Amycolatopsis sp. FBCC-B4732]
MSAEQLTPCAGDTIAARNARMVQLSKNGATYTVIAKKFGLSLSWTGFILRSNGAAVPEHGKGVKRRGIDWPALCDAYDSGDSVRALAEAEGLSYGTVYRGLRKAGITFRPRGGDMSR